MSSINVEPFRFLNLPVELQENIISYLSYDDIARQRLVCLAFDNLCQGLLNKGFLTVEKYHGKCHRAVKAMLPRRESERRSHPLARHCDIFNAVETRLSLLSMTFIKYMEQKLCCFIPGKVIDEIYRILKVLNMKSPPPRAHEILQELRDISSMAMEHFDEKIVPILRQKLSPSHIGQSSTSTVSLPTFMGIPCNSQRDAQFSKWIQPNMLQQRQLNKKTCNIMVSLRKQLGSNKLKISELEKKVRDQEKTILELNHTITDQNAKIAEQEGRMNELSKKFVDYEKRFNEFFSGMGHKSLVLSQVKPTPGPVHNVIAMGQAKLDVPGSGVTTRSKLAKTKIVKESPIERRLLCANGSLPFKRKALDVNLEEPVSKTRSSKR